MMAVNGFYDHPANIFMLHHTSIVLCFCFYVAGAPRELKSESGGKRSRKLIDPFIFIIETRVSASEKLILSFYKLFYGLSSLNFYAFAFRACTFAVESNAFVLLPVLLWETVLMTVESLL